MFCDADARPGPRAVERTVALHERFRAGVATLMPRQILGSWAERAVIPVLLHVSLLCFVPLALVPRLRWRRLGIGNGQWLSFTRAGYATTGGHAAVRDHVVEDIGLARRAQTSGAGLAIALAPGTLTVRMYRNAREVWDGFGKNLYFLTGGRLWNAPFWLLLFALVHVFPWALWPWNPVLWAPSLALLVAWRILTAWTLREPLSAVLWQPVGALLLPLIAARSLFDHRRRRLTWKGRRLDPAIPDTPDIASNPGSVHRVRPAASATKETP